MVSKVFEKLVNNRLVDHLEKCGLFLISSMVVGLLDQLQIFRQLFLIELLGLLTGLGLLELKVLIYPRLSTGFGMLVFFINLSLMVSGKMFGLISSFLSNRILRVILYGKSSQEYLVNAEVPHGPILSPYIS